MIEALRVAFHDCKELIADPVVNSYGCKYGVPEVLSAEHAARRADIIKRHSPKRICDSSVVAPPEYGSDTTYFSVMDAAGNAVSFVESNYHGIGTNFVPAGCGFTMQNRGANFSVIKGEANCLEPGKRAYHTIIAGMATKDDKLYCTFGNMGGFMQPAGHVQLISNLVDYGMCPQRAIDFPRFCIEPSGIGHSAPEISAAHCKISLEKWFYPEVFQQLKERHGYGNLRSADGAQREVFGRAQIIGVRTHEPDIVRWAGSESRCDGYAFSVTPEAPAADSTVTNSLLLKSAGGLVLLAGMVNLLTNFKGK